MHGLAQRAFRRRDGAASVSFWFEFASTYSYPAAMLIEALAAEKNVTIAWRPFLLGPIFRQQGWSDSPFNLFASKGRYMWRDVERICEVQHIPFRRPTVFPRNGLLAARVACRFAEEQWLPKFVRAVYRANFEHDLDISSVKVISDCLRCATELDCGSLIESALADASKTLLRRQTADAVKMGIFGAPSFTVDTELFWGGDRLLEALDWATMSAREP